MPQVIGSFPQPAQKITENKLLSVITSSYRCTLLDRNDQLSFTSQCCVLLTKIGSARRAKLSSHNAVNEVPKSHLCFRMFSFSSEKDYYKKRAEEAETSQDPAQVCWWLYF